MATTSVIWRADLDAPFRGMRRRRGIADSSSEPASPDARIDAGHSSATHPFAERRVEHFERASAFSLVATQGAFLCGVTAAVIHRLPVPLEAGQALEVGRLYPSRAPRWRNVLGVQIMPRLASLTTVAGLRVTTPVTTWAMLARRLTLESLVVLGDAIVYSSRNRPRALGSIEELTTAAWLPGRPGAPILRRAVSLIRVGAASPPESKLRLALVMAGLPEPTLDVEVRDGRGRLLGRSELAYPQRRIAIEYESDHHRVDRGQWNRDIEKYQAYVEAGWQVLRVTAEMLRNRSHEVVQRVSAALGELGTLSK
ncbi:hypothetical protein GCM10020360_06860 [Nonlabens tegetincola]